MTVVDNWTKLTPREALIVATLCEAGDTNSGIAQKLGVTPATVKFHLTNVMYKSGAANRVGVVLWWIREGRYANAEAGT